MKNYFCVVFSSSHLPSGKRGDFQELLQNPPNFDFNKKEAVTWLHQRQADPEKEKPD
jgi:hypothetical protein